MAMQPAPPRTLASLYEPLLDSGYIPDFLLRTGIRHLLSRRKRQLTYSNVTSEEEAKGGYVEYLKGKATIAVNTKEANEQQLSDFVLFLVYFVWRFILVVWVSYEVPTAFFKLHLGPRMKYSSCFYESGAKTLEEAEIAMLDIYVKRSGLEDGMTVLDLGCGWGSVSLYLAEKFPKCKITGLSNSHGQREYIMSVAKEKGFKNLEIVTGDINEFNFPEGKTFDRIISIEMFEHMKNFASLFHKVSTWLVPTTGRLFVHVFAHKNMPYDFKTDEDNSWMARYFFTGGTMPSKDLFMWFQDDLKVVQRWAVDGRNYGQTSEHWLQRLDACKTQALPILEKCYGSPEKARIWFQRWRIFYLSVAELFNYEQGQEWVVMHYLFKRA
ncbi:hypothetical protein HDV05_001954 [Chytridiales sp. JEL 0842]|nr:hypothetical protein HDV05_001954 [Chytridiales sp. JEL 0842]